jgi:Tfp pilus assembly protein PilF
MSLALVSFLSGCASSKKVSTPTAVSPPVISNPVVLVCDIDSLTDDPDTIGLSLAVSSLFRRDMFCVKELSIVPSEDVHVSLKPFFLKEEGLKRLGRSHGADVVVVGFLEKPPDTSTVQLAAYDVTNHRFLFKTTVSGKSSAIFNLEKQLVEQLCAALNVQIDKDEHKRIYAQMPSSYSAFINYGKGLVYENKEKFTEALIAFQKATTNKESVALVFAAEAQTYEHLNAPLKAMHCYQKAVEHDPSLAEVWYRLNLYAVQFRKDDRKALEYCRNALEVAPRFGKARLSLGTRLHDLGHLSEAIAETRVAAEILRTDPIPFYNLGLYYLEAGDRESARTSFERSLQLDQDFERAKTELQKLRPK